MNRPLLLILPLALSACAPREDAVVRREQQAAGPAAERVSPIKPPAPFGSAAPPASSAPSARAFLPRTASSSEAEAAALALLTGATPDNGLPTEAFDPDTLPPPRSELVWSPARNAYDPPAPIVRVGPLTLSGKSDPAPIREQLRRRLPRLRQCYEDGLRETPALTGTISIKLSIDRDGFVTSVRAGAETTIGDRKMVTCVIRTLPGVVFPAMAAPEQVTASFSFTSGN